jgi:hypothetical protein
MLYRNKSEIAFYRMGISFVSTATIEYRGIVSTPASYSEIPGSIICPETAYCDYGFSWFSHSFQANNERNVRDLRF